LVGIIQFNSAPILSPSDGRWWVWEDSNSKVWISYNSPAYLQARHNLPAQLVQNIAVVEALAKAVE